MLYNRLSDTELERAVYVDLNNVDARNEMVRRAVDLMDTRSDELQDLEMQLENVEKEHKTEVANLEEDLNAAGLHARELATKLDQAHDRIAELTRAEDLV